MQHLGNDLDLPLLVLRDLQPVVERLNHLHSDLFALHLTNVVIRLSQDLKETIFEEIYLELLLSFSCVGLTSSYVLI